MRQEELSLLDSPISARWLLEHCRDFSGSEWSAASGVSAALLAGGFIFQWIGETILKTDTPLLVKEINFLQRPTGALEGDELIAFSSILCGRLSNGALEMQAVYFSGDEMSPEFRALAGHAGHSIPFPVGRRRPDDRSSGPKRLMPQLQTKVPSLRRWGKKMAVVIDEGFFSSLGKMEIIAHVSNCDIAGSNSRLEF